MAHTGTRIKDHSNSSTKWLAKLQNEQQWRFWFRPSTNVGIPGIQINGITHTRYNDNVANIIDFQKNKKLLLQGPMTTLLMQQTMSSSQEEDIIGHTRQVKEKS